MLKYAKCLVNVYYITKEEKKQRLIPSQDWFVLPHGSLPTSPVTVVCLTMDSGRWFAVDFTW